MLFLLTSTQNGQLFQSKLVLSGDVRIDRFHCLRCAISFTVTMRSYVEWPGVKPLCWGCLWDRRVGLILARMTEWHAQTLLLAQTAVLFLCSYSNLILSLYLYGSGLLCPAGAIRLEQLQPARPEQWSGAVHAVHRFHRAGCILSRSHMVLVPYPLSSCSWLCMSPWLWVARCQWEDLVWILWLLKARHLGEVVKIGLLKYSCHLATTDSVR